MSFPERHSQLETLLRDAYTLLSELEKRLLVVSDPVERARLRLEIDSTRKQLEEHRAELGQLPSLVEIEGRYLQRVIETFEKQLFDYTELDSTLYIDKTDLTKGKLIDLTCLRYAPLALKEQSRFAGLDEAPLADGFGPLSKDEIIEGTLFEQVAAVARGALLGAPGGGKTTSFRRLAVYYARLAQTKVTASLTGAIDFHLGKFPVLIPLGGYQPSKKLPFTFIEEFLRRGAQGYPAAPELADRLHTYLQVGKLLILLDAVNEVAEEERQKAFNDLAEFAVQQVENGNSIFFSCREKDYLQNLADLPRLVLAELDDEHIRRYLGYHFEDKTTIFGIENKLDANNKQLRTLVRNPYMLRVLVNVYQQNQGQLPHTRGELFRQFGRNLLSRALLKPESQPWLLRLLPEQELIGQSFNHLAENYQKLIIERLAQVAEPLLGRLAYQMLLTSERGTRIPVGEIEKILPEEVKTSFSYRPKRLGPSQTYQLHLERWEGVRLAVNAGLLRLTEYTNQPEADTLEFSHQLLEEYFAASYLQTTPFDSQEWRSVVNYYDFDEVLPLLVDLFPQPDEVIKLIWQYDFWLAWRCAALLPEDGLSSEGYKWLTRELLAILEKDFKVPWEKALEGLIALKATKPLAKVAVGHKKNTIRSWAAAALTELGAEEQAITAYVSLVGDSDNDVRRTAVDALTRLGAKEQAITAYIDLLRDSDSDVRRTAADALAELGTKKQAITAYVFLLRDSDSDVRQAAADTLAKLGAKEAIPQLTTLLEDSDNDVRHVAAAALAELGAKEVIPQLITLLRDSDNNVRRTAAAALAELGAKEAIPQLTTLLEDSDSNVRRTAADTLTRLGAKEQAITAYIDLLGDSDSYIRSWATDALTRLGAKEQAIAAYVGLLRGSDSYIRSWAAAALAELGAKEVIPHLITLLGDNDSYVYIAAAAALAELGAKEQAIAAYVDLLGDSDSYIQSWAAAALAELGAKKHAIIAYVDLLGDSDSDIRRTAAAALARLGAKEQAIAAYVDLLGDSDSYIRSWAADALAELGAKEQAITAYIDLLGHNNSYVRHTAAAALAELGAKEAIPQLITLLRDSDSDVRRTAADALARLGAKEQIIAADSDLLEDSNSYVYSATANASAELGTKEQAITAYVFLLRDSDNNVRRTAAAALAELGAKEAIPQLTTLLGDSDSNVRRTAADTLTRLGAKEQAITAYIDLLGDSDSYIRSWATDALTRLGAKEAAPQFITLLGDSDYNVRRAAADALKELGNTHTVAALSSWLKHENKEIRERTYELREHLKRKLRLPKDL